MVSPASPIGNCKVNYTISEVFCQEGYVRLTSRDVIIYYNEWASYAECAVEGTSHMPRYKQKHVYKMSLQDCPRHIMTFTGSEIRQVDRKHSNLILTTAELMQRPGVHSIPHFEMLSVSHTGKIAFSELASLQVNACTSGKIGDTRRWNRSHEVALRKQDMKAKLTVLQGKIKATQVTHTHSEREFHAKCTRKSE
ncbi:hypothetical protein CAPTEDRAFT_185575 [Capitella teleta]|uniref:Uncharacterized protein n=1 Tax=Capitella teleta TaxID=283909 RepID=R7VA85_CAPTE|nr:hypothetical protein CAPTEDRAFT_185575 [Capitella teleta]|eukprot:ELU12630.1 hypothetical protein CAPTEDRAFT_185575 [Capitella teleta]